ncbi:MAG: GTPase [Nitrosopumilus sp. D6]|nr:MAG: GTPase [Nitrosopumilus sp. D6]
MKTIFISGTAGSGKSLLTSKLLEYYTSNGAFAAALNLDPGVENLPYECDVDVRDFVDVVSIMKQYDLGPNGALIMANDLIASKCNDLQTEIGGVNPDYLIVDTPGQIELFAYRSSGKFLVDNLATEEKTNIFLFDGALVTEPLNFISIALLAASIRLRLNLPALSVMTKTDLIGDRTKDIQEWSSNHAALEAAVSGAADGDTYSLTMAILRGLDYTEMVQGLIPVSNVTGEGLVSLEAALSRILNLGEEVED